MGQSRITLSDAMKPCYCSARMPKVSIPNLKDTAAFAKKFARHISGGDMVMLEGNLGAGKTTFVKALAKALGVTSRIRSPSFTLLHVYKTSDKKSEIRYLVHADAYRIDSPEAWHDIGLTEWFGRRDAIVCVEWGEKIKPLLKGKKFWHLKFKLSPLGKRTITIGRAR